jgi:hypothetical protein
MFYQNYLAMSNTADVTGDKPIAVWSQSISGANAINPLVAFYDIHGRKREVLFFYFVLDTTRDSKVYTMLWLWFLSLRAHLLFYWCYNVFVYLVSGFQMPRRAASQRSSVPIRQMAAAPWRTARPGPVSSVTLRPARVTLTPDFLDRFVPAFIGFSRPSTSLRRSKLARTRKSSRWIICCCPLEAPLKCTYKNTR